jgi:type II secretory pathway pseudopilin PulG
MNGRKQKYPVVLLVVVVISSLLILTASFGGIMIFQTITGQQENQQNAINSTNLISNQTNGIANQSGPVVESIENQTVANQTGTAAALLANLTQGDFETLSQDLTEARQASENNDTNTVLDELNSASGELFQVVSRQFDPAYVEAMTQEFNSLQTHIDQDPTSSYLSCERII